ncbi:MULTISPECIES: tripartite tricarboxylate transporter TctB family protein [Paenibacillus]|uniref:Tripartite tricarboxylate transporter family receptor n=1 Tax=Paenibacillus naphthalenovorans TaxID=162209 RepID=A0A0U2VW77_9BACL|nr:MULTISPECIES: tripartite tricarboxylate transporter TctB family protein [Paenibacillus]ALS20516.1 tripartite tricarboxylate transporter family receptor [Paenibacillus naphthalenovorans]
MKAQNAGVWGGLVLLIYAGVLFVESLSLRYYTAYGPGPGFFPIWLNGVLIILALGYIWLSLRKEVILFKDIFPKGKDLKNVLSVPVSILIFMLIVNTTGFVIGCTVLLFLVLVRQYKWNLALGISLTTSVVLFVVFVTLMEVPLPVNIFGW